MTPGERDKTAPSVSVIMATDRGTGFPRDGIDSILTQTLRDFELIVADDGSDGAADKALASIDDPRVRVVHTSPNIGSAQTWNLCLAEARGRYVAMLDRDDLSHPARLEKQAAYLDRHPGTVLLGTGAHNFRQGRLFRTGHPRRTTPLMLRWLMHMSNPLHLSSVMLRAAAARRIAPFARDDYRHADELDLYHRMMALGDIARLDESLTVYRLPSTALSGDQEAAMIADAVAVLTPAYRTWFGDGAAEAVSLIVTHLAAGKSVPDSGTLARLRACFQQMTRSFALDRGAAGQDLTLIEAHADMAMRRAARTVGRPWRATGSGMKAGRGLARSRRPAEPVRLYDTEYKPVRGESGRVPALFLMVDTEAEFDWERPFGRHLTGVSAMDQIERGQEVFDQYGLRPIYAVDYPVASQDSSVRRLRAILDRGGCYIGAHLHPWTVPPFEEQVSDRNSFPGNLPPALEEKKLGILIETIHANFGVRPRFYKAGRYGIGRATAEALARHGIEVDLSVLPGTDLRRIGGPDFREFQATPYWVGDSGILSVPMTRGQVGLASSLGLMGETMLETHGLNRLRLRSVLSRLRLMDTLTLTPEGVTAAEQIRLIRTMLDQDRRILMMHFHSPSLQPGNTPYVRDAAEADRFLERLRTVFRFFFEELGGLPGHPSDLLRMAEEGRRAATATGGEPVPDSIAPGREDIRRQVTAEDSSC